MDENSLLNILYTYKANSDAITIRNYLLYKFTQREVDKFYELLRIFENIVAAFPQLYPKSVSSENVHRAVLSKQLAVFYKISESAILVIAILDNRMDNAKWP
jgi:plasmid stabilization system protein ParE